VIATAEELRRRILAQDFIGIVSEFDSLHRANQGFIEEHVFDAVHLESIKKHLKN
jgi:hypothetical protein